MSEQIGFIGLGRMGLPMARNLIEAGYRLVVYNRTPEKAQPLVDLGARLVEHPGDVAEPGGVVITMLADDRAVEAVVLEPDGILGRLSPDGIHLSMSTISPSTSQRLARLHADHGSSYLAAPVLGRPDAAAARKLNIILSGPEAARKRVQVILQALGQAIYEYGDDPGAANVVKLAGNFMIVAAIEAIAEASVLVEKNGIDPAAVMNMYTQGSFACPIYQGYSRLVTAKQFTPAGFQLSLGYKDISLVLQTATNSQMPMPFASLLHDRLLSSIANGRAEMDWTALAIAVAEDAGLDGEAGD